MKHFEKQYFCDQQKTCILIKHKSTRGSYLGMYICKKKIKFKLLYLVENRWFFVFCFFYFSTRIRAS